ncbi:MAG: histidine kinase [Gammaproteobacteria bacterium]|jgi:signal transduction histidine kinase|nr:histidine kinase [Gammaproteobacteria bacterium]|tara:strand:- start:1095 stop:2168 length:1074 start_codon:yes stop_codon:yes gene_type:complete
MKLNELPTNSNYQFWTLQIVGWSGWVVLFTIRDFYWGQPLERVTLLGVQALAGLILTTGLRYIYQAVWEHPIRTRIMVVVGASYLMAAIWQPVKNYFQFAYYDDYRAVEAYGQLAYFSGIIGYSYFLILCWSGLYFALKFYRLLQQQVQKSIKAESMAHEAQLRMLRYQLNPHFLFNTLNAISTLILSGDNKIANEMLSKLSNFLRYSLDKDPMGKVDIDHEINTMKHYLEIEKVRFDERLQLEFNVEDEVKTALVPSLLLQPLVENSIKYAVANSEKGGKITIGARAVAGNLLLEVSDNGPGIEFISGQMPVFNGVGIVNTKERLEAIYGLRHSIKFNQALPSGLMIEIRIPFETE